MSRQQRSGQRSSQQEGVLEGGGLAHLQVIQRGHRVRGERCGFDCAAGHGRRWAMHSLVLLSRCVSQTVTYCDQGTAEFPI